MANLLDAALAGHAEVMVVRNWNKTNREKHLILDQDTGTFSPVETDDGPGPQIKAYIHTYDESMITLPKIQIKASSNAVDKSDISRDLGKNPKEVKKVKEKRQRKNNARDLNKIEASSYKTKDTRMRQPSDPVDKSDISLDLGKKSKEVKKVKEKIQTKKNAGDRNTVKATSDKPATTRLTPAWRSSASADKPASSRPASADKPAPSNESKKKQKKKTSWLRRHTPLFWRRKSFNGELVKTSENKG
jgi:hypothetical protein